MFFAICQKPKSTNDSEEYRKQLMIQSTQEGDSDEVSSSGKKQSESS